MPFAIKLLVKKLLSEDRIFQQATEVAIADGIAAKESMQVQQQLSQPVHAVTKDAPPVLPSRRNSSAPTPLPPAARQGSSPRSPPQSTSYTCFSGVTLTISDLNANSGILCATTTMEADTLL